MLAGGCASSVANVADQPLFAAGWSGPPPHVAVQVTGAGAGPTEQKRCVDAVTRAGAVVDAQAPVQALVTLEAGGSRLQVTSTRRGLVRDEPRPGWTVERLCNDALLALVGAIRAESPQAEAARAPVAPMAPARLSTEPSTQPDGPPPMANTSGGIYSGPIPER